MKILFIVPYYKPANIYGGPVVVVPLLGQILVTLGYDVTVFTTAAKGKHFLDVPMNSEIVVDRVKVTYFKNITADNTFISFKLWREVAKRAKEFDVVHVHTWWNFLVLGSALICKLKRIKPVISPHGMFSEYILNKSNSTVKYLIQKIIGERLLKNSWLHVSSEMEWDESQKIVKYWQGCIIPNLVKLSDKQHPRNKNPVFTIGYLSRLDPKKGLDLMMKALSKVDFEYKLLIAGTGDDHYVSHLKKLSRDFGISKNVEWVGWKENAAKFEFLAQIDLFTLTSHSENFAIVIIESLSVGTPVLISNNIGLFSYIEDNDFGWVTDLDTDHITAKLNAIYRDRDKIASVNLSAPYIVLRDYELMHLAEQYVNLYRIACAC